MTLGNPMIGWAALRKRTRWHVAQVVPVNGGPEVVLYPTCATVHQGRALLKDVEVWVDRVDLLIDGDEDTECPACWAVIRAEDRARGLA